MEVSKLIAGFLFGMIVTLAVVYLVIGISKDVRQSSNDQPSALEATRKVRQTGHANRESGTAEDTSGYANDSTSTDDDVDNRYSSKDPGNGSSTVLSESQSQNLGTPQPDSHSTSVTQNSAANTHNEDYPPEIAEMIKNRVDKDLQARYENDKREGSWAPYMEGLLTAYFGQKPTLAQFYFSLIDCRTSVCEIHALGYGPDALTQWNTATADMVSQPWFEFDNMSLNRRNPEPDVLAIVLILTKKPPG
jgi:hypothetical protein